MKQKGDLRHKANKIWVCCSHFLAGIC